MDDFRNWGEKNAFLKKQIQRLLAPFIKNMFDYEQQPKMLTSSQFFSGWGECLISFQEWWHTRPTAV